MIIIFYIHLNAFIYLLVFDAVVWRLVTRFDQTNKISIAYVSATNHHIYTFHTQILSAPIYSTESAVFVYAGIIWFLLLSISAWLLHLRGVCWRECATSVSEVSDSQPYQHVCSIQFRYVI